MAKFVSSLKAKLIYVFRINDMSHAGCLKVGEATLTDEENLWGLSPSSHLLNVAAKKRINQYTQTAGITYDLLYTELSIFTRGGAIMSLTDGEVHKVLERSGIKKKVFDIDDADIICDTSVAKISIVGAGMESHPGTASKMFEALYERDINIDMIATSEIKISVLIDLEDADRAVSAIHKAFFPAE